MINELIVYYFYYVIKNDNKNIERYHKLINKVGIDDITLRTLLRDNEIRAIYYVMKYYLNSNFTLEMLHDRLHDLFKTYKNAVTWLVDNGDKIKNYIKEIEGDQND